jgi:hypothetical protein
MQIYNLVLTCSLAHGLTCFSSERIIKQSNHIRERSFVLLETLNTQHIIIIIIIISFYEKLIAGMHILSTLNLPDVPQNIAPNILFTSV